MTEAEYKRFVFHQRSLCDAHINLKLDELCENVGLKRGEWRTWKFQESMVRMNANISNFMTGMKNAVLSMNELRVSMGLLPIEEHHATNSSS